VSQCNTLTKIVAVHGFKGLPAFGGAVGDQGSEVQGYVLVPCFVIPNLKVGSALAIMWQNQHFLRGLRVFNFVLVPNPESRELQIWMTKSFT
jgi:hypothetical protein